ncbi:MAG: acyl-CoA dehydrogenase, partial [Paracoccaceae bacterium]
MNLGITDRLKPLLEAVRTMIQNDIAPLDGEFYS